MTNLRIAPYESYLSQELRAILKEYLQFTANEIKEAPWNFAVDIEHELAFTFDNLQQFKPPKGKILVATIDSKLVGTASIKMIRENVAELKRMYVVPEFQGKKIGQALLEELFTTAINFGAIDMFLESPPPFKPAHKLYKKNGFELFHEYPEVSIPTQLRHNWVYMRKTLKI